MPGEAVSWLMVDSPADTFCSLPLLTLREITMLQLMDAITEKQEWEKKGGSFLTLSPYKALTKAIEGLQR